MKTEFDIALIEMPGTQGLSKSNVIDLYDMLKESEAYPMEIGDINGCSSAMGFITPSAAEKLDYEYNQQSDIGNFIASILDDTNKESDDGTYVFNTLDIYITRD